MREEIYMGNGKNVAAISHDDDDALLSLPENGGPLNLVVS